MLLVAVSTRIWGRCPSRPVTRRAERGLVGGRGLVQRGRTSLSDRSEGPKEQALDMSIKKER